MVQQRSFLSTQPFSQPVFGAAAGTKRPPVSVIDEAVRALQGLAYGTLTLTVKDGQVVQLEYAEKRRVAPLEPTEECK